MFMNVVPLFKGLAMNRRIMGVDFEGLSSL
jgi:hypothetical protein